MKIKKGRKWLFAFVVVVILVLLFSVMGVVVLYLGGGIQGNPSWINSTNNAATTPQQNAQPSANDDQVIYEDPLAEEAQVEVEGSSETTTETEEGSTSNVLRPWE